MEVRWIGKVLIRFDSSIHKNTDLNDNDKFSYLQSFLCSSASESITRLTKTAENYTQKQPTELFYKNGVLKNLARKSPENTCTRVSFCGCVQRKKLCNCRSSFFFFSFFPSRHFFWTDWQKLLSEFCPIAALSACDQDWS